jgi:2-(1,2-epoxy-1,2-dihydrophenyl)acetyl-CoA isomerase
MSDPAVLYEARDGVAWITLNRPDVYNTINLALATDLAEAALQAEIDPAVRAVVLRGAGTGFSAGGDLKDFDTRAAEMPAYVHEVATNLHTAVSRLARMHAPVIAAVHGSAAGAGMSLAMACDLAVAAASARFTMAYTRIGLVPDGSSSYFLPRLVGLKRALDLALTNRMLSAAEALEWGVVSEVVEDGELETRVTALARDLAAGPTAALGLAKRLLHGAWNESLETQMAFETQAIAQMAGTADAREGIRAFIEKRPPRFRG